MLRRTLTDLGHDVAVSWKMSYSDVVRRIVTSVSEIPGDVFSVLDLEGLQSTHELWHEYFGLDYLRLHTSL